MSVSAALVTGLFFALANGVHCAGMCGAFAMRAAASPGRIAGFLAYGAGKALTYGLVGALAGALGAGILGAGGRAQAVLGIGVALVLVLGGVARVVAPPAGAGGGAVARLLAPHLAALNAGGGVGRRFALGVLTAALPCGVVYFAALQAAATGDRVAAFMLMLAFAAGTLPALAAAATLGSSVARRLPPNVARFVSGGLLVVLGLLSAWRAALPLVVEPGSRPCCH